MGALNSRNARIGWVMIAGAMLAGCLGTPNDVQITPISYLSFYHGSPDTGDLTVRVDNGTVGPSDFLYAHYYGYYQFYAGTRTFTFSVTSSNAIVLDTTLTLSEGILYSLYVLGVQSDLSVLVTADTTTYPAAGNGVVRFVHLSPDAGQVDVLSKEKADTLFTGSEFGTGTAFMELESGIDSFVIRSTDSGDTLATTASTSIESAKAFTIVLRGFRNPPQDNTNSLGAAVIPNY